MLTRGAETTRSPEWRRRAEWEITMHVKFTQAVPVCTLNKLIWLLNLDSPQCLWSSSSWWSPPRPQSVLHL